VAFVVKIHKNDTPKFPPICIGCRDTPTTTVKVSSDAVGWWSVVRLGWIYGKLTGKSYQVPACAACAKAMKRDRRQRAVIEIGVVTCAMILAAWVFRDWESTTRRWAIMIFGLAIAAPWFFFDAFVPEAVSITVTSESVTFHFADEEYALDFEDRNPSL